jgi:cytochrome b6-f complex iron-sulfur subunit
MNPIIIGIVILALLGVVLLAASFRRTDTTTAIGQLSGEAVKRDRGRDPALVGVGASSSGAQGATGREVELAVRSERSGALLPAESTPPVVWIPPDPETLGVTRRQFLNRSIVATFGFGLSAFGVACLGFLWPPPSGGFGAKVNVGKLDDIKAKIKAGNGFFYVPEGRMWVTEFPETALAKAGQQYTFFPQVQKGLAAGVTALYQTCPHLGCRVPSCLTSQWFECPCHGSKYNRVGEKKGGPAPRGMDRFPMEVTASNELIVNTGSIIQGPAIGTNTTGQEAEGPNCISVGGGHS